jgi:hypothetical protein
MVSEHETFPKLEGFTFATPEDAKKAERLFQRLTDALVENHAQAHYFLCHTINGHPSTIEDGTCSALHCSMAREALGTKL